MIEIMSFDKDNQNLLLHQCFIQRREEMNLQTVYTEILEF